MRRTLLIAAVVVVTIILTFNVVVEGQITETCQIACGRDETIHEGACSRSHNPGGCVGGAIATYNQCMAACGTPVPTPTPQPDPYNGSFPDPIFPGNGTGDNGTDGWNSTGWNSTDGNSTNNNFTQIISSRMKKLILESQLLTPLHLNKKKSSSIDSSSSSSSSKNESEADCESTCYSTFQGQVWHCAGAPNQDQCMDDAQTRYYACNGVCQQSAVVVKRRSAARSVRRDLVSCYNVCYGNYQTAEAVCENRNPSAECYSNAGTAYTACQGACQNTPNHKSLNVHRRRRDTRRVTSKKPHVKKDDSCSTECYQTYESVLAACGTNYSCQASAATTYSQCASNCDIRINKKKSQHSMKKSHNKNHEQ